MALHRHRYVVDVEYNCDPGYHPITVTVDHYREEPALYEAACLRVAKCLTYWKPPNP